MANPPGGITKLMNALHSELRTAGLVRKPNVAGAVPPMYVDPIEGPPEPGTRSGIEADQFTTTAIRYSGSVPPPQGGYWQRTVLVDLWVRTKGNDGQPASGRAFNFEQAVRDRIFPDSEPIRTRFTLGVAPDNLEIIEAQVFRDLGEVEARGDVGYSYVATYSFEIYD